MLALLFLTQTTPKLELMSEVINISEILP